MSQNLLVTPGPHLRHSYTTQKVMLDVVIALLPAVVAAGIFFRLHAAILIGTCVISCVLTEYICNRVRRKPNSLGDLSAVITGLILALSLPPMLPWWAGVIGSAFAIAIGKMVYGGLGCNIFNPAMIGRTFLTACFGVLMTTWTVPATINPDMPQVSQSSITVDAITRATPLALSKDAIKGKASTEFAPKIMRNLFWGDRPGCLGETSSFALGLGALYLIFRFTISWELPFAVLLGAYVAAAAAHWINPAHYMTPIVHILSGGMLLCAFFIATDPVTAPITRLGGYIFGIGVGVMTILIRTVGEYPEGVMFAVLLMNALTPMIDRITKQKPIGGATIVK